MFLQNFGTYLPASDLRETNLLPTITYVIKKLPTFMECDDLLSSLQNLVFLYYSEPWSLQFISSCPILKIEFNAVFSFVSKVCKFAQAVMLLPGV